MRTLALALAVSLFPGASAAAKTLTLTSVTQEQNQWCWAGTTRSALLYLGVDKKQCELAEWTRTNNTAYDLNFGYQNCCTNPSGACNSWNYFWDSGGSIEELVAHFAGATAVRYDLPGGTLTQAQITATIDAGKLFFIRWARSDGSGHFLVGHGYDGTLVHYLDPWPGEGLKVAERAWMVSGDTHSWSSSLVVSGKSPPPPDPQPVDPCSGKADGVACDDGDACTTGDRCMGGQCQGAAKTCAADACHDAGTCDPATGQCGAGAAKADGTRCDDGDACTTGDRCHAGQCEGTAKACTAIDACHEAGTCSPTTGACTSPAAPDGTPCSGGTCSAGACDATTPAPTPTQPQIVLSCSTAGGAGVAWPLGLVALLALRRRRR
jgi:uncharacterized protein (TIGR03382 family)